MSVDCRKILGANLTAKLSDAGLLQKVEDKIQLMIDQHGVNALAQDASTLGGRAGETGLEHLKREVVRETVNDVKQKAKDNLIEAKNVVDMHNTIMKDVAWFEANFPKNPIVKKSIAGDKMPLIENIMIGKLYESNFSKGASLEKVTQSTFGKAWGIGVDKRLTDEIGDDWYLKFAKKREDIVKVFDDLIAIVKDPARRTSVNNSNSPHYKIARAIADSFEDMMAENNRLGGKMNINNLLPKARLNSAKITNKNRQQAIDDFVDMIDDAEITRKFNTTDANEIATLKKQIAEKEVNRTVNADPDDEAFGNITNVDAQSINRDFTLPKDGESYYNILSKYGAENDYVSMLFSNFQKLSEQHAMTKMFGNRPLLFLGKLKQQLETNTVTKQAQNTRGFEILESGLKLKIEKRPLRNSYTNSLLQSGRNLTLGKLGFVFVDQLLMEPVFSFFRLMTRGNNSLGNIFGNIGPLQGKQKKLSARFHNVAMEGYIGAVQNRFFGSVYESGGRITSATRRFANLFMKYSGSQFLSDGQAAAGFNVQRLDVTESLKSGMKWKTLKQKKPAYALDLEQAGITETIWDNAMRGFKNGRFKDSDNLFDPSLMPTIDNTLKARGQTDYDAWMSFFQKRVDGLSRMKPGEIESARLTLYSNNEAGQSIMKTLMQFKSFSFAVGRRMYGDAYLRGGSLGALKTGLYMTPPMFVAGIISTQAREILKGGDDKRLDDPLSWLGAPSKFGADLISMAWARSGISAIAAPLFDPAAEHIVKRLYGEYHNLRDDWEREMIGPAIASYINILKSGVETVGAAVDPKKKVLDEATDFGQDILSMILPNGLPLSQVSKYLQYDVLEKTLSPDDYKNRNRRNNKRRKDRKSKGARNLSEWVDKYY